jgi:aryl-alcohol dehydrogenase-like predicted oxidoreductase
MKHIELPGTGIGISQAVFGTSRLGGTIERYDKGESMRIIGAVADAGVTTFDTADLYAQGNSEKLLGEALRKRREEVVIATKGGYVFSNKLRLLSRLKPLARKLLKRGGGLKKMANKVRGSGISQDFSAAHLTKMVEGSLKRLRTDRIDIYQLHSPDTGTLQRGEVFETLGALREAGKIRSYGASLLSWDDLGSCLGKGVSFVQIEADLLGSGGRAEALLRAAEAGVVVVARQPFASGLMAKSPENWSLEDFGGDAERLEIALRRFASLQAAGDPFEVVIRLMLHLQKNLQALSATRLSKRELDLLAELINITAA